MLTMGALDASHRAAVDRLLTATGAFSSDEVGVALELFDEVFAAPWRGVADYEFVGAFDPIGALAGYACYGPTPGTEGTYDLYWLAVEPAQQGRGVGAALLAEVERCVGAHGGRLLVVETSGRDPYAPARRFYGAHGYAVAARVRDFYAPADDRVVFTRYFRSPPSPAPTGAQPS